VPPYASLTELKGFLRIAVADTTDDTLLTLAVNAATEAIDLALGTTAAQLDPVPSSVKLACQLQASRWYKRQDAPFGVLGSPEFGNYSRLLSQLDPDVEVMLGGYGTRKRWGTTG
jgi:hypothetical protein